MPGRSWPKDDVASLAYGPGIHKAAQREQHYGLCPQRVIMDCRVKPGNDAERAERNDMEPMCGARASSALKIQR
jgi:hypothetical protein